MKKFDWDDHYAHGGKSGDPEEYRASWNWKHGLLYKYYNEGRDSILDVGCGDLQFWNQYPPENYTGVDISQTIIDKHRSNHPNKNFKCFNAATYVPVKADVVICFDVLWHIHDDIEYLDILNNLARYSNKYIYIYTWGKNPFGHGIKDTIVSTIYKTLGKTSMTTDGGGHQKYRDYPRLSKHIFEKEYDLIETHTDDRWGYGTMYIYKKK